MLALVRVALTRPYTFVVLALLILIVGPLAALRTPIDIFPEIRIPVIAVVWQYTGLPPDQMSGRVMLHFQRSLTTTVNDIEHIEGTSYTGVGIVKVFFQPGADISTANAQVTAISQTVLKQMPPNITPPLILNYNASTVPIIQLALAGKGMSEQAVFDLAINTVRTPLVTVPGAAIPFPFGGKFRQIQIDLDPAAHAVARPVGQRRRQRAGGAEPAHAGRHAEDRQLRVRRSSSTTRRATSRRWPTCRCSPANGAIVYLRDVAQVRDGNPPQTQHRACRRRPLGAAPGAEERRGLDARHHRRHQGSASRSLRRTLPEDARHRRRWATSRCSSRARSPASPRGA